jgi:hypothetical protein
MSICSNIIPLQQNKGRKNELTRNIKLLRYNFNLALNLETTPLPLNLHFL